MRRLIDATDVYYLTVVALIRLTAWSRSPRLSNTLANTVARWRDVDGQVTLAIDAPIDVERGALSAEAGTAAYVQLLESYVRRYPSEYYGWHIPS